MPDRYVNVQPIHSNNKIVYVALDFTKGLTCIVIERRCPAMLDQVALIRTVSIG
ncbi:hypothetical protein SP41_115 [Salmonella phage 41]|nr:hypothetical protein SP41_115 [Salmonella phage 41]